MPKVAARKLVMREDQHPRSDRCQSSRWCSERGRVGRDYYAERVGVITGAGSGIGRALALELARRGASLALWDRDADTLSDTASRCRQAGATVRADVVDVTERGSVLEHATAVQNEHGHVDLVFCVAGVIHTGSVLESDFADVQHVVDVNLWGVVHTVTALLPYVIASGGGHVVTVSSAFGLIAAPRYSAYNASKFAVRGFTESLRQEMLADHQPVSVTCVYPGGVRTPIIRSGTFASGEDAPAIIEQFDARIARTTPEKAARVILRGVRHGRAQVLVGPDARLVSLLVRVAGVGHQRIMARLFRRP